MVKIVDEMVELIQHTHISYCDDCGKILGSAVEHDDGYAAEYGCHKLSFDIHFRKDSLDIVNSYLRLGLVIFSRNYSLRRTYSEESLFGLFNYFKDCATKFTVMR